MKEKSKMMVFWSLAMCGFLPHACCQSAERKIDTAAVIIKSYGDELPPCEADPEAEELSFLLRQNFTFGSIYFSGKGFRSVSMMNASSCAVLKSFLMRCRPGSVISFEYCVYKKRDGKKVGSISKSFIVK